MGKKRVGNIGKRRNISKSVTFGNRNCFYCYQFWRIYASLLVARTRMRRTTRRPLFCIFLHINQNCAVRRVRLDMQNQRPQMFRRYLTLSRLRLRCCGTTFVRFLLLLFWVVGVFDLPFSSRGCFISNVSPFTRIVKGYSYSVHCIRTASAVFPPLSRNTSR